MIDLEKVLWVLDVQEAMVRNIEARGLNTPASCRQDLASIERIRKRIKELS